MIIQTRNTRYVLKDMGDGAFLISGSAKYCPVPTPVQIMETPQVGGSLRWVYTDVTHPHYAPNSCIRTSEVLSVEL